jgi:hypothetical protein
MLFSLSENIIDFKQMSEIQMALIDILCQIYFV